MTMRGEATDTVSRIFWPKKDRMRVEWKCFKPKKDRRKEGGRKRKEPLIL